MPSVPNYFPKNLGILRSIGIKKKSQKPIINNTLKKKNNNNNNRSVASTASFATTIENYDSEFENNNPKINTNKINNRKINKNEINTIIEQIDTTNEISKLIPELIRFKETWKTFSDDKKKDIIEKIKSIVESEHLLKYLQKYNKNIVSNIAKNNDTRFTTVFTLLDLLIQKRLNFNVVYPQDVTIINNRNKFENLIYKLKHIEYTPGNTSASKFTSYANEFIEVQLSRSVLQINKLGNEEKNKLISILLNNKSFKKLLDNTYPTKEQYFAWVDKTFGI